MRSQMHTSSNELWDFLREHFGNLAIPPNESKHFVKASKDEMPSICLQFTLIEGHHERNFP